jgi:hypothetical protein
MLASWRGAQFACPNAQFRGPSKTRTHLPKHEIERRRIKRVTGR